MQISDTDGDDDEIGNRRNQIRKLVHRVHGNNRTQRQNTFHKRHATFSADGELSSAHPHERQLKFQKHARNVSVSGTHPKNRAHASSKEGKKASNLPIDDCDSSELDEIVDMIRERRLKKRKGHHRN